MTKPKENDVVITVTGNAPSLAVGELIGGFGGSKTGTKAEVLEWAHQIAAETLGRVYFKNQETGLYTEDV